MHVVGLVEGRRWLLVGGGVVGLGVQVGQGVGVVVGGPGVGRGPIATVEEAGPGRRALGGGRGRRMLGRHRRVAEAAVVGRRLLRRVHHLPLGGNEGTAHRMNGSKAIELLIVPAK